MQLQDLLDQVRQRRKNDRLEKERIADEKQVIKTENTQRLLRQFESVVQKYFGDILDALNADKSFQYLNRDLECSFTVRHAVVSISMLDRDIQRDNKNMLLHVGISAKVGDSYFSKLEFLRPSYAHGWHEPQKARDSLLELIFDIYEEYDRLLPEFETARKRAKYRQAIEEAVEKSNQEIAVLKTVLKEWQWPEGRQLTLYKITYPKHGFLDSNGEAHFDYEFGWALSDFPRSFTGYYNLLPERNKPAREVKPGHPVTVERHYLTENTLPEELLEKATQQLELVKVYDCIREDWEKVLPQFLPPIPPEIAGDFEIEPAVTTFNLDIPPIPCFEIRQALSFDAPDTDNRSEPF